MCVCVCVRVEQHVSLSLWGAVFLGAGVSVSLRLCVSLAVSLFLSEPRWCIIISGPGVLARAGK